MKARGTLLVDKHCGNGCSIKRAPLYITYYNEISGGHIGRAVVRTSVLLAQYYPCGYIAGPVRVARRASTDAIT